MNKDPLKDPRSDALNPSLGKEGNALFIVGGIRWIKRCSWWGWHAAPVSQCVCLWASLSGCVWFRWHPECICVYIQKSDSILCVCVRWGSGRPMSCSVSSVSALWAEPARKSKEIFIFSFQQAFHVLSDECVYWLRNENQLWLVSQII